MKKLQGLGVASALIVVACLVTGVIGPGLFDLRFPFSTAEEDHSPPVVLTEIRELAEFRAAEAEFEVIVDQEKDVKWVPGFIAGERVQYVAVGTVEAIVDFGSLTDEHIVHDADERSVLVVLPEPTMGEPEIDFDASGVMNRDRGLLDRVGGMFNDNPTAEEGLIVEAGAKMTEAAAASDLLQRAETSTERMLQELLAAAGVESVSVVFERTSAA
ncbi:MAG: DUF4230 domain-containing protein [Actinomycetota bacterium]